MSEAGGVPHDDPDTHPSVATAGYLFHPTVIETKPPGPAFFGEHLGELAPTPQTGFKYPFQHVVIDHDIGRYRSDPRRAGGTGPSLGIASVNVKLEPGRRGEVTLVVGDADTAVALGSGDVAVLATPRVVALVEQAAVAALDGALPVGSTSVGMRVQLDHLRPTAVGVTVVADAVLERIEGRRLVFTVSVSDPGGLVAAGRVTRVLVEVERFLGKTR